MVVNSKKVMVMSKSKNKLNRREFIESGAKAAVAGYIGLNAPYIIAKKTPSLRILGTHVTLQEELRKQAMKDLGINLIFEPKGSAAVLQKAASSPESFDLYEQWSDSINILWQASAIQPLDVARISNWSEINSLSKTGKLNPDSNIAAGDSPNKLLYVQKDKTLSANKTDQVSFLPYVHNVDSFGYNVSKIDKGIPYETESWGWLLDEKYKGKVGLVNAPTIGIFDAALAAQASGLMKFKDIGNMTTDEIDKLFLILNKKKAEGHFAGFWSSVPQSIDFMVSGRANIQSMFSPAISGVRGKGIDVQYAAP